MSETEEKKKRKIGLTVKTVEHKKEPGYWADGKNLYLRVTRTTNKRLIKQAEDANKPPPINKTWAYIYKKDGKRTEIGMGSVDVMTLDEAREERDKYKKQLKVGDPLREKKRQANEDRVQRAKMITFQQCASAFINKHQHELKNKKHIQQWTNTLAQYAYPYIGQLPIEDIDTNLVMKCLEPIWITKNETASRVRGRIEQVLSWATVSGYRAGDNPARWRGHLNQLLAKPSKVQNTKHHPALPYTEISAFMEQLRQQQGIAAKCLEFTILTAARTNEAIGAVWGEINLDAKVWTIPKERMKAENEHLVPLSDVCIDLLIQMESIRTNDFIFPGQQNGLSNMAMLKLLDRMGRKDLTVHGFRSTFRDWSSEVTHYPNEVLEKCLAHTIGNEAEAAYRRGALLKKRFDVMKDWAKYCDGLIENV